MGPHGRTSAPDLAAEVDLARCSYCGIEQTKGFLKEAAYGGAVCKDWFACQRRHDHAARPARKVAG